MTDDTDTDDATDAQTDGGETLAFVAASKYRPKVLTRLVDAPATPSRLADDTGIPPAHVSRAIQQLREYDLVELVVPEDTKKGRVYDATQRGARIADRAAEAGVVE